MERIIYPDDGLPGLADRFQVLAVGRKSGVAELVNARHHRRRGPFALIQLTLAGSGFLRVGAQDQPLPVGSGFCLCLPERVHFGSTQPWERVWLSLGGSAAIEMVHGIQQRCGRVLQTPASAGLAAAFCDLHACAASWDQAAICTAAFELLVRIATSLAPGDRDKSPPIAAALAELRQRLADPQLCLADLARAAGLSRHHFGRRFTSEVGMSPMRHLQTRRLKRAAHHLLQGDEPIKAIALSCGFRSRQVFHAAFCAAYGLSPSVYRRSG